MHIRKKEDVTPAVLEVVKQTPDPRTRELMLSMVKHLHAFVTETRLTEEEFRQATKLINEIGQASNDGHNEAVLLAGALGVSSLVCLQNNGDMGATETTQNLLGPFWRMHSPETENGGTIVRSDMQGDPMLVDLSFRDQQGEPVEGLEVDIWHCSPQGFYENQEENQADHNFRGKFKSDQQGRIWFRSIKQSGYPVPTHAVTGKMLTAQNRDPFRPAHLHVLAHKENYKTLISQIYSDDDPNLENDVAFGVTEALIGNFKRHEDANGELNTSGPWYSLSHELVMEAGVSELPLPPIR